LFGIEVDSLAKVAGTRNLMPDLDGTVKDYRDIDVGVRRSAPTGILGASRNRSLTVTALFVRGGVSMFHEVRTLRRREPANRKGLAF
jgi:hypothetical protein